MNIYFQMFCIFIRNFRSEGYNIIQPLTVKLSSIGWNKSENEIISDENSIFCNCGKRVVNKNR